MTNEEVLYAYLKANHNGRENGIPRPVCASKLKMTERELRRLTKNINSSLEFEGIVSTTHSLYLCNTKEDCEKTIKNTYRVAVSLLKKAKCMEKKVGLNNQIKMQLGKDYKDIVKTFEK